MQSTEIGSQRLAVGADHRAIWLMERYRNNNGRLGVPLLFRISGALDRAALEGALADLAARHDALRTTYEWENRTLTHVVNPVGKTPVSVEYTDLLATAEGEGPRTPLNEQVLAFLRKDFSLKQTSVHVGLWQAGPEDSLLVINLHHIITDAWSNALLIRDLAAFYNARTGAPVGELPEMVWQFSDHVARERRARETRKPGVPEQSGGALAVNPFDAGGSRRGGIAKHVWVDFDEQLTGRLERLAERDRTSLTAVLLTPFFVALGTHETSTQDTSDPTPPEERAISVVFANRQRDEVQETVGRFTDMRTVRARADAAAPIADVLREVDASVEEALSRVGGNTRSDDDELVFHLLPVPPTAPTPERGFAGLDVEPARLPEGLGSRFRLQLLITPCGDALEAVFRYDCDLFDAEYVEALAGRYAAAVRTLAGAD